MRRLIVTAVLVTLVVAPLLADEYVWIDRVEENGRMLVPLRGVFEAVGAAVDWTQATQQIDITMTGTSIRMQVDNSTAVVNGNRMALDVPPRNVEGRVYIPLRFAGEALGKRVDYRGDHIVLAGGSGPNVVLLISGEATSVPADTGEAADTTPSGGAQQLAITSPVEGQIVGPRIEVYGTAPAGSMIVVNTEARARANGSLLKVVPGLRHSVGDDGTWHVAVAAPVLPANVAEPLYYVVKAYYQTPGYRSPEVSVKVYREQ
ncbi:MAG: copper amine oxidase N-terminal domain-containing protein [Armatimonadetes bacterium]|nr:copper amine oxidase N-terminal domain-containing protein [Armatimonadota bacterium]